LWGPAWQRKPLRWKNEGHVSISGSREETEMKENSLEEGEGINWGFLLSARKQVAWIGG